MKKNSFSNYMNTTDNPLDEDGNEIKPNSKGSTSNNPPVVKKLIEVNNKGSTEVNNAIGVKVEPRQKPPLTVESDEHIRPATLAWNVEWLKKREIAEIENGGLGSAPLLERTQDQAINNDEFTPLHGDSVEKGLDNLEHERLCDETALKSLSNKKAIMEIQEIPGPNFDMGYNPIENMQPILVVKATKMDKGKGICIEAEPPLKKCKILGTKYNHERESRRTISFRDHLRSPYVRRAVDMKVMIEEKRIHAWATTTMGGEFETVFELDNGASLMRGNLENLEKPSGVFPQVVDGWAEFLNYEERYRSRESIRRYFFTTKVMWDNDLRTPFTDFNSQFEIFSRNLSISARLDTEILKMRNVDLVFFPVLDTVNYYLVVFNFKNPSIVVIDNRYWEGCDTDEIVGNYEHVVDILHRLMIKHLESVDHPVWIDIEEKKRKERKE
ncbi:hypothetical protein L6452_08935 [Arctium lappa]|uniref:Uncharacterized protein n=1 Tax=Arctium lappa TaxID=4217 RepID=A0ACB9DJS6_ARCLA|nr:hypothetical protein L6452_08935 [Arctium lappa]